MTRRTRAVRLARGVPSRLADEQGQSLMLVLIVVMVLTISTTALATLVTSSEKSFGRDREEVRAIALGRTGLNYGVSYLSQWLAANDSSNSQPVAAAIGSSSSPQYSGSVDGGTVKWWATKTASDTWTVFADGVSPTAVVRHESIQMRATVTNSSTSTTVTTPQAPIYGYGYVMADPNADCAAVSPPANGGDTLGNSAAITVPVFIASSLCLSGGGSPLIAEPATNPTQTVTLYVGKVYQTEGNSSPVGTSARPILSANVVGGCKISFHGWKNVVCSTPGVPTSGTGSGIWASSYQSQQVSVTKPVIDTSLYGSADLNKPSHNCAATTPAGAALSVGLFKLDSDTIRNTSLQIPAGSGSVSLLHLKNTNQADTGNNFDCRWYDSSGTLIGRLAWSDGNPGTLTVQGTTYIDGNLSLSSNDKAIYTGVGVIYVDGTVTMSNGARLCAGALPSGDCSSTWDTTQNNLEIVAVNHNSAANAASIIGDARFQGILFMNGNFLSSNSGSIYGSVIADSGQLSGDAQFANPTPAPPGAPGGPGTTTTATTTATTTWNVANGTWTQG
jgi:Tfp pilus assembly protein PilX